MKLTTVVAALMLAGMAAAAQAQTANTSVIAIPGMVRVKNQLTIDATVTALDAAKRLVTVKTAKGEGQTFVAGPEVKNFAQIKVGDVVHGLAVETLTIELIKGGAGHPVRLASGGDVVAAPGAKPSGATADRLTIIADVIGVDRAAGLVQLKGVDHTVVLEIVDPAQLKLVEVGDAVRGTYEVSVAVSLATVPPMAK